MNEFTLKLFRAHAVAEFPRECCGVIVVVNGKERYVRCRNIAAAPDAHFILHPEDVAAAEDLGELVAVCHSHPNEPPAPSDADRQGCEDSGVEWHILNVHAEGPGALHSFKPSGWQAPLLGLPFSHGVHDCYSLIRRYYRQELKIELPDFARDDNWWHKGQNLYLDNFESAGFVRVDALRTHDVVLMKLHSPVPNHAAVHAGGNIILQHLMGRLSSRDVYGGWYREITTHILRHRSQL